MRRMDDLFTKWKNLLLDESDHFVEDGVICSQLWNLSNRKILFILKETNSYKRSITSLINDAVTIRPKSKLWLRPTFHNIGRWAYGLLNYPESVGSFKIASKERKRSLLSCAFINIKKTTGGRTAGKAVEESAKKYSAFLREQIEILSPDIIVFGGTYRIMKDHVLPEMEKVSHRIHKYKKVVCVNANHPACTKKRKYIYEQVINNFDAYMTTKA